MAMSLLSQNSGMAASGSAAQPKPESLAKA